MCRSERFDSLRRRTMALETRHEAWSSCSIYPPSVGQGLPGIKEQLAGPEHRADSAGGVTAGVAQQAHFVGGQLGQLCAHVCSRASQEENEAAVSDTWGVIGNYCWLLFRQRARWPAGAGFRAQGTTYRAKRAAQSRSHPRARQWASNESAIWGS